MEKRQAHKGFSFATRAGVIGVAFFAVKGAIWLGLGWLAALGACN